MKRIDLMTRLISCIIMMTVLLSSIPVMASADVTYEYIIEGESYAETNFSNSAGSIVRSKAVCSKGNYLGLYKNPTVDTEYYAQWNVTVDETGIYNMDIASTPLAQAGWSSVIYMQVNGGEEILLKGEKFAALENDTQIAWYHTNALYLTEGSNTIKFIIRDRVASNNTYVCFVDCFTLTKGEFALHSVSAENAPYGVYQQNQELSICVDAKCVVSEDTKYVYEVIDYLGKTVRAGTGTISKGQSADSFVLDTLPKGHYTVAASSGNSTVYGYMSVVTSLADRKKYDDTPFGIDAMPYGIYTNFSKYYVEDYCDLIELSGVTWIRDRCYFTTGVTPNGDSYDISLPAAKRSGEILKKKGIKVSTTFNYPPRNVGNLTLDYSTFFPTDLVENYKFYKALAEQYDGLVTVWEPFNELDLGGGASNNDSPDLYSSILKAMAIGVSDADTEYPVYLTSEPASSSSGPYYSNKFIEMMFENDLFDYAAIDNYHSHRNAQEPYNVYYSADDGHVMKTLADGYRQIFKDYDVSPLLWNTESGIYLPVLEPDDLNAKEQAVQAKYIVTSSVEAISYGSDKYLYFCGPDYQEGSRQWGMVNRKTNPVPAAYASWASISALTHVTGQGDYLGYIDLGEDVAAYAFADGDETAFVFWAKTEEAVDREIEFDLGVHSARYFDFFANETALASADGRYKVKVSDFPTYIKFTGRAPEGLIQNPENIVVDKLGAPTEYSKAQRIILTQKYDDATRQGVRTGGYKYNEKVNKVTVEVTNLNDTAAEGTITAASTAGWKVTPASQTVSVEPMATASVEFEIIPDGFKSLDSKIVFQGQFDGELTSKSVAYGKSKEVITAQPIISDGQKYLKVDMENTSDTEKTLNKIDIKVNDYSKSVTDIYKLQASETTSIMIPVEFADDAKILDVHMEANFDDGSVCTFTSSVYYAVVGDAIDTEAAPQIVLPQDGEIKSAMHYGEDDLSAKIWLAVDEKNFYMTAHVTDNNFCQEYTDSNVWNGDGFQFAIGNGLPSTGTKYAEIGIADTPKGPQVHCWTNQLGGNTGLFTNSKLIVEHEGNLTKYAVTIPWSEIPDFNYENMLMSFSLLLNENDGDGRLGYIEWGSGIGSRKLPEQYRTILFK